MSKVNKLSQRLQKLSFPWEDEVKKDLLEILSREKMEKKREAELVIDLMGVKKILYLKSLRQFEASKKIVPSEFKKELKSLVSNVKKAKQNLCALYPDLEDLRKHAPFTQGKKGKQDTPYLWIIEDLDRIEYEATKTAHMRHFSEMYYNQKNKIYLEKSAIFPAATFCARAGIRISAAEKSRFHTICRWMLSNPDDDNDRRGSADLRKPIAAVIKNWRQAYPDFGG